jgi:hypothetical protein
VVGLLAPAKPAAARRLVAALVVPVSTAPATRPAVPLFLRVPPLTEAQLLARYPHVVPGSLRHDPVAHKNAVDIKCAACGAVRIVYTSDLFHVRLCRACKAGK